MTEQEIKSRDAQLASMKMRRKQAAIVPDNEWHQQQNAIARRRAQRKAAKKARKANR